MSPAASGPGPPRSGSGMSRRSYSSRLSLARPRPLCSPLMSTNSFASDWRLCCPPITRITLIVHLASAPFLSTDITQITQIDPYRALFKRTMNFHSEMANSYPQSSDSHRDEAKIIRVIRGQKKGGGGWGGVRSFKQEK